MMIFQSVKKKKVFLPVSIPDALPLRTINHTLVTFFPYPMIYLHGNFHVDTKLCFQDKAEELSFQHLWLKNGVQLAFNPPDLCRLNLFLLSSGIGVFLF